MTNKVELNRLSQVNNNEQNFLAALNDNLQRLQAAINDTLSRTGVSPNQMEEVLDMNGNRICNVGAAVEPTDVVTKQDIQNIIDSANEAIAQLDTLVESAKIALQNYANEYIYPVATAALDGAQAAQRAAEAARDALLLNPDYQTIVARLPDIMAVVDALDDLQGILDNMDELLAVSGDLTNIDAVAANLTDLDAIAGNLSEILMASTYAQQAAQSASNASSSASNAATAASSATASATQAASSATSASTAATSASTDAATASSSATQAAGSASSASSSATSATSSANTARIWAEGTDGEVVPLGGSHSAKVWAQYVEQIIAGTRVFGGSFDASTATATLTNTAKVRLGTDANTIVLTNDTTAVTGYAANEAVEYVVTANGTFAGIPFEAEDILWSSGTAWHKIDASESTTPDASESVKGVAMIATTAEAAAGTNDSKIMTPAKTMSLLNTKQDTLTAGTGIDIANGVISNTGLINTSTNATGLDVNVTPAQAYPNTVTVGNSAVPGPGAVTVGSGAKGNQYGVSVGYAAGTVGVASDGNNVISIGNCANSSSSSDSATAGISSIALGAYSNSRGTGSVSVGNSAITSSEGAIAIGRSAVAYGSSNGPIAIGQSSTVAVNGTGGIAIGKSSSVSNINGIAIGNTATATQTYAIQIGPGFNTTAHTLKIGLDALTNVVLLDSSGKVPVDRYIAMTGADGTNAGVSGAVPAPAATDNDKFLRGDGTWGSAGSNYTAGTGIDITNDVISVTSPTLTNTATGTSALTVGGTASTGTQGTNVGIQATAGNYSTSLGYNARSATTGGTALGCNAAAFTSYSTSLGAGTQTSAANCIALGAGARNGEAKTFKVALANSGTAATDEASGLYTLLNSSGKVPVGRYIAMSGASSTDAGSTGTVPAPAAGDQGKFLRGDGTWQAAQYVPDYDNPTASAASLTNGDNTITLTEASYVLARTPSAGSGSGYVKIQTTSGNIIDIQYVDGGSGKQISASAVLGPGSYTVNVTGAGTYYVYPLKGVV